MLVSVKLQSNRYPNTRRQSLYQARTTTFREIERSTAAVEAEIAQDFSQTPRVQRRFLTFTKPSNPNQTGMIQIFTQNTIDKENQTKLIKEKQ